MAEPVWVLAIPPVGRAAARLDIGRAPRVRPKRAQHRRGVERPRPHLHIVGLEDDAALRAPIVMERENQVLKAQAQAKTPRNQFFIEAGLWPMESWRASSGSACRD